MTYEEKKIMIPLLEKLMNERCHNCDADDWEILTTYAVDFPGGIRYYQY